MHLSIANLLVAIMKLYAGWYVVGFRKARALATVAGPVQSRERAEALLAPASAVAVKDFDPLDEGDTFAVAWIAFPERLLGVCNAALWVNPEFQEYDA